MKDTEGRYVLVNDSAMDRYGLPKNRLIGKTVYDLHPKGEADATVKQDREVLKQGVPIETERELTLPDGSKHDIIAVKFPIRGESGEIVGVGGINIDITERKRAEREAARANARLNDAIESIPDGFALYDADDRLVLCNERYREIYPKHADVLVLGSTFEDMLRDGVARGEFSAAIGREEEWIADRLRSHADPSGPIEQELSDGRWLRVEERRTREGGIVGLRTDFTAIKRAERSAAEATARLNDAIESIAEGFVLYDAGERLVLCNSKYRELNPSFQDILVPGVRLEDVIRASAASENAPIEIDDIESWTRTRLQDYRAGTGSREILHTDGRWILARERRMRDGGMVGIRTDITEIKQHQQELRESEDRYRRLIEASPDGLFVTDKDGIITFANSTAVGLYGAQSVDQLVGLDMLMLVHPDDRESVASRRGQALQGKLLPVAERRRLRLDGSEFVSESRGVPFTWDGETGILIVFRDITERKRIEEELHQARKMEAVGQLTGGVAHDFNNLLMAIQTNAFLLRQRSGQDDLLDAIVRASRRGADLTSRLLAFSRQQALRSETVDLNDVVTGMSEWLRRTLGEAITFEVRLAADLWSVVADAGQLESALLNLAINASDAMANGGTLVVETANARFADDTGLPPEIAPGDYAVLAVTDSGTGIPEDVIDQVIEPFFTTKEVGKGSGLGLSMVYGFSKQSGGTMKIESETGRGTTVRLYLPRGRGCAVAAEPNSPTVETSSAETVTILVVEDNALVRDVVVEVLRRSNHEVLVADNGAAALAVLDETEDVDVLFTDIVMPEMSGLELWTEARARRPRLKVIYTSGYSEDIVSGWPKLEESSIILRKPYDPNQLLQALRETISYGDRGST